MKLLDKFFKKKRDFKKLKSDLQIFLESKTQKSYKWSEDQKYNYVKIAGYFEDQEEHYINIIFATLDNTLDIWCNGLRDEDAKEIESIFTKNGFKGNFRYCEFGSKYSVLYFFINLENL